MHGFGAVIRNLPGRLCGVVAPLDELAVRLAELPQTLGERILTVRRVFHVGQQRVASERLKSLFVEDLAFARLAPITQDFEISDLAGPGAKVCALFKRA